MRDILRVHLRWLCAATVAACLSACGSAANQGVANALLHGKTAKNPQPAPAVADPTAEMAVAVSATKAPSPVSVKFDMQDRPQPGQPLKVDFALIPDATVMSLAAKFEGDEGLTVIDGDQIAQIDKLSPKAPIRHTVTVLPKADGIYTVTATLTVTTDAEPRARAFSIPIIAGSGLPQLAAHAEPGKTHP